MPIRRSAQMSNELRSYAGRLSEKIFGWRRIDTPEVQGHVDWLGRSVHPKPDSLVTDRKSITPLFGIGSNSQEVNTANSLYSMLSGRQLSRGAENILGGVYPGQGSNVPYATLLGVHRRNEIIYRCIRLIAQSTINPRLDVEDKIPVPIPQVAVPEALAGRDFETPDNHQWKRNVTHRFARLIARPNKRMSGKRFFEAWLTNWMLYGKFFAEKQRSATNAVVALWPLDTRFMEVYEYQDNEIVSWKFTPVGEDGKQLDPRILKSEDVFYSPLYDPCDPYFGAMSPTAVAMGSTVADIGHTEFVRQFYDNKSTPGGILLIKNKTLIQTEADDIKLRWWQKFSRAFGGGSSIAVLDQNAEFQPITAKLNELDNQYGTSQVECRLCMVYGVPPVLALTHAGIERATYSNSDQAETHFWSNTLMPLFDSMADDLTWEVLVPDFEGQEPVLNEDIRLKWDTSKVKALQEDVEKLNTRARENVRSGIWKVSEARELTGAQIDPFAGYYLHEAKLVPAYPDIMAADASILGQVPSVQIIASETVGPDGTVLDAGGKTPVEQGTALGGPKKPDNKNPNIGGGGGSVIPIDSVNPQAQAIINGVNSRRPARKA